jgi:hypothetical protein
MTTAFLWSLLRLCTTYGIHLVIVLSLFYLRLSFGHCIVSLLLIAFVLSLYVQGQNNDQRKAVSSTQTMQ